jgi:GWT1
MDALVSPREVHWVATFCCRIILVFNAPCLDHAASDLNCTFARCEASSTLQNEQWCVGRWILGLVALTLLLWGQMWAVAAWVQPVSRRACNAAYILWMLAFNMQVGARRPAPASEHSHFAAALCPQHVTTMAATLGGVCRC